MPSNLPISFKNLLRQRHVEGERIEYKAPMFVIDYVILHELAHLLESNHTPRFCNIVRAKVANAEKAKAWLKERGQMLEEEV